MPYWTIPQIVGSAPPPPPPSPTAVHIRAADNHELQKFRLFCPQQYFRECLATWQAPDLFHHFILCVRDAHSASPPFLYLVSELAIRCERRGIKRIIAQRTPGNWNIEADWLSRPHERGSKPERLSIQCAHQDVPEELDAQGIYLSPPGVAPALWSIDRLISLSKTGRPHHGRRRWQKKRNLQEPHLHRP